MSEDSGQDGPPISPNENGDRDSRGRFRPGWRGGPGSPGSRRAVEFGQMFDEALGRVVTPERLDAAIDAVLTKAQGGDVRAFNALADRLAGAVVQRDIAERLALLEANASNGNKAQNGNALAELAAQRRSELEQKP